MPANSRRAFLQQAAAIASVSKPLFGRDPFRKTNLGVELYTVRNVITKDPKAVLQSIKEIGYTEVEATDYGNFDQVWSAIQETQLTPASIHVNAALLDKDTGEIDARFSLFKQRGFRYVVYPYVAPEKRGGADVYKRMAASLNKAGERAKAQGLTLCYHNHAFEFERQGDTSPLQILMTETAKDHLALELDIFWVTVAGHDPVDLLKTYAGRVPLLHLKDKAKGIPAQTQYNEKVPRETFKEVGNGSIDVPAVLKAADSAGVKHYFVEQDQTPGDPLESLRQSYAYLSKQFKG
ncbi:MAG: sugar phosphate isomerase/epimerase family protein [Bryobacteraceae bacterium]